MGEEFLNFIAVCVKRAKEKQMKAYLYDEDRWPSGFAGGLVTKDEKLRSMRLAVTNAPQEQGTLFAKYDITLRDGFLQNARLLSEGETGENVWYIYKETRQPATWYNNCTYVDTLNKKAIEKFIEVTHEPFFRTVGEEFGGTVPSIFTDEPQYWNYLALDRPGGGNHEAALAYTDGIEAVYEETYGENFLEKLPEFIWNLPGGAPATARYRYHALIAETFAASFADTIGAWCEVHGIALTGHMMEEQNLCSQTMSAGDIMRSLGSFQLPGIDILCDKREYSTAKQAQSASHQQGREGVLSELYGVTNWDYDFRGHKLQGDWQAALGVTNRVQHLSWYSMEGEAKRDYPASIFYQSPWYKEYKYIENHFARVCAALTRGKARVRVGVVHPLESYWLNFGPIEQTQNRREELEKNFDNAVQWLLFSQIDFDFISEALLPAQAVSKTAGKFGVGAMEYDAVVIPACETIRQTTLRRLEQFALEGGTVIFAGEAPRFVDAMPSGAPAALAARCVQIPFTKPRLVDALSKFRDIQICSGEGTAVDNLLYQMREDGADRWLFVCNGKRESNMDVPRARDVVISVFGEWDVTLYDTLTGEITPVPAAHGAGKTDISQKVYDHDSFLFRLTPAKQQGAVGSVAQELAYKPVALFDGAYGASLSEPNALLLDSARWRLLGGAWQGPEDVLIIDNKVRSSLGIRPRGWQFAQPWSDTAALEPGSALELSYTIQSELAVDAPVLAIERPEYVKIFWNGTEVVNRPVGYFVDECLQKVKLPRLEAGENTLLLQVCFNRKTNLEWCYILGDFGVTVAGARAVLTAPEKKLRFDDLTRQKLPFYTGNVTYQVEAEVPQDGEYALEISKFRAPVLSVSVDGVDAGRIVFAPYRLSLGLLKKGRHVVEITAFGNRANAFGPVHNCNENERWHGPGAWHSHGEAYTKNYQLGKTGILREPVLLLAQK
jgi:hypothetical protein